MSEPMNQSAVKESAIDASRENRPGVPMEKEGPVLTRTIGRQASAGPIIHKRSDLPSLTPAYGTSCPPRGLSGAIRRAAYQIPDNRFSHWMLLMLGDRVDVAESTIGELVSKPSVGLFVTLGVAAAAIVYLRRAERRV